ncbi:MAG: phage tail tape measure protein [Alphaproteobacteria bacterium]|nr:phage tail tape measure protein [Alphaproteobacteria bacterium]
MADLSKTIQIVFDSIDQSARGFESVKSSVGSLAEGIEEATQPLADLTAGILAADAAALALGAAFVSASVKASVDFESALTDLNKVLGEGDGQISDYIPQIREMSDTFATSGASVAGLAGNLKQAGFTADEVFGDPSGGFGLADLALQAVKISTLDADAASAVFVRTLSGFQEPASEASRLLDILNEASNTSGASFEDLAEAFGRVGPVAQGAGLSFEETAGFLVVLNEKFQSGEISATAFSSIMLQLGSDSASVAAAMEALGIAQTDLNGAMRPTSEIIADLAAKWPELTKEQQNQAAQNLVGLEQAPKLLAILNDYPGVLEAQAIAYASTGSAQKEFNTAIEQSQFVIDRAKVQFENLSIAVGDKFKPSVVSGTESMGLFAKSITDAVEGGQLEPFFEAVLPLFDDFAEYIAGIAEALPEAFSGVDWSEFERSIEAISESFGGIFGDLDLTNPEDLAAAIQALVDVGTLFINATSGIIDGLEPLFTLLGQVVGAFTSLDPEVQNAIGYFLGLSTTVNVVAGVVGSLSGAIGAAGAAKGLIGSFAALGPAIAGASVALAGFEVGKYISEVTGLDHALEDFLFELKGLPPIVGATDEVVERSGDVLAGLSEEYGIAFTSIKDYHKATQDGRLVFDEATQTWIKAGEAVTDLADATKDASGITDEYTLEFMRLYPAMESTTQAAMLLEQEFGLVGVSSGEAILALERLGLSWQSPRDGFAELSQELREAGFDDAAERARKLGVATEELTFDEAAASAARFAAELQSAGYDDAADAADGLAVKFGSVARETEGASESVTVWNAKSEQWVTVSGDAAAALKKAEEATSAVSEATKKSAAELEIMNRASADFILGWEEIQSAERVAIFEARADIQVAQIEADAERTVAAFESMSASFASTGEVLTELFGIWAGLESSMDQAKVEEWIEREYELREQIAEGQLALIEAEIKRMEAQTAMIEQGGMEVKISSDGLEPYLEAFMFAVVDRVRTQISGSYEDFLLGCGS